MVLEMERSVSIKRTIAKDALAKIRIAFLGIIGNIPARIGTVRSDWGMHALRLTNASKVTVMVLEIERSV